MMHGYNMKHGYLKQISMRYTGIYQFQGTRKLKATGGGKLKRGQVWLWALFPEWTVLLDQKTPGRVGNWHWQASLQSNPWALSSRKEAASPRWFRFSPEVRTGRTHWLTRKFSRSLKTEWPAWAPFNMYWRHKSHSQEQHPSLGTERRKSVEIATGVESPPCSIWGSTSQIPERLRSLSSYYLAHLFGEETGQYAARWRSNVFSSSIRIAKGPA